MDNTPEPAQKIHFVVACMGRLEFVKQTIEAALAQPDSTYTFVDYSCPEKSGEWVKAHYPQANVVFSGHRDSWNPAEARNLGAKTIPDGWYCTLDSDVVLHPEFSKTVLAMAKSGAYLRAPSDQPSLCGMLVCRKADFDRCGGYDQVMRFYGWEDLEIRLALERSEIQAVEMPLWLMRHIDHDDSLRTRHCDIKKKLFSTMINMVYAYLKDTLLRAGEECDEACLRRMYHYAAERFLLGYPWLSWPEPGQSGKSLLPALWTLAEIARDCQDVVDESFGGVRAFRIARSGRPDILELLTTNGRETVSVRVPGRTTLSAMTLFGERFSIPVEDGLAHVSLTGESIFLRNRAELVRDVEITVTPVLGSALIVELNPGEGLSGALEMDVAITGQPPHCETVNLDGGGAPARLTIPVVPESPEKPRDVTVTVTGAGIAREVARRATFLTAAKITGEEAAGLTPPDRLVPFQVAGRENWVDVIPDSYQGPDDLSVDVAWGWTETDLVCWMTRHDDVPGDGNWAGDGVQIAIQPENSKAVFAPNFQFTLCWEGSKNWVLLERTAIDPTETVSDILIAEGYDWGRRLALRMPFSTLGITPHAGDTLGVSMLFNDDDGYGRKGWLEWGGGIGDGRSPRRYNEITLAG